VISSFGKRDFDLIVMGTKGATGIKEIFLGSNTWDAIEEVQLPLIAVPEDCEVRPLKKIIIAIDRKEFSGTAKFEGLIELAKRNSAEVTVLHVGLSDEFSTPQKNQVSEWFQGCELKFAWLKDQNVEKGIHDYAEANKSDMVVLINRKRSFWENLFHSSVTRKVAFHSHIPLYALHD
jgi:nucleotide-binding universal stress UspA family protein